MALAVHAMPAGRPRRSTCDSGRQAPRKRASFGTPEATLAGVRKAIRAHRSFTTTERKWDFVIAFLLFTGLLLFLQLAILSAAREQRALRALRRPTIRLSVEKTAETPQIHALLQTILRLPQVALAQYVTREQQLERVRKRLPEEAAALSDTENPFSDGVDVTLRPPEGFGALFAFLRQSRLQSVLRPQFLWELPDAWAAWQSDLRAHRSMRLLSILVGVASLLSLSLAVAQFVRGRLRLHERKLTTLRCFGASPMSLYLSFVSETGVLLIGALGCSFLLVTLFYGTFLHL